MVTVDEVRSLAITLRYNWALVRLAAVDASEMRELVLDAWAMVLPRKVAAAHDQPDSRR